MDDYEDIRTEQLIDLTRHEDPGIRDAARNAILQRVHTSGLASRHRHAAVLRLLLFGGGVVFVLGGLASIIIGCFQAEPAGGIFLGLVLGSLGLLSLMVSTDKWT